MLICDEYLRPASLDEAFDALERHPGEYRIVAGAGARLRLRFGASTVHLVLGGSGALDVLVDGRRLRTVKVSGPPRLYTLASFTAAEAALLELRFGRGLSAYAFTFG